MRAPPTGTVTFLFTDLERSTQQWEAHPDAMTGALRRHDDILRAEIAAQRGHVFSTAGDAFSAAFWTPHEAVAASRAIHSALAAEPWPSPVALRVRIGIHTGTADEREGDYFGPTLNRAARLMAAGHGGQILLSEVSARLVDAPDLVDLGEQRLKDLAAPERVFQVGTHAFPALRASGTLRVRLPEWETRFWGREAELDWLTDRVPRTRLVVLTGPGGLGKTRLAAQAAERLVDSFPEGIAFVGLAGIGAGDVEYAIADGIGVRREPDRSALESAIGWIADRRVLLVLDNCEEVVPAARSAAQQLVHSCPRLHVLSTSRVPLGVAGELRRPVPPLAENAAVALFVDRAQAMDPGFDPTAEADALRELCRRLDAVPLAVELAAARCRTFSPDELLARLGRPDVLSDTTGLFEERHRDLDRLIEWSWDELSWAARGVLARLSVIIGSFTLETAEAIGATGTVDERDVDLALEEIEDAGLVIRERLGRDVRHHLLEPIRQHVAQHLDDEQRASAAHRHALRFAALANEVKAGAVGPEFGRWADIVERDLANFREAHRLLLDLGDVEAAVAIVDGLALVGAQRGLMEMADWCDLTVAITEGRGDRLEVAALAAAAPFWYYLNRVEDTIAIAARAADLPGDPDHHVVIEEQAVRATLDPTAWALAASRIRASLTRYDPACETWAGAYSTLYLVLLDDLDAADVAPIEARLGSSLYSAAFEFYRAIPHYLRDEDRIAAHIADQSVALARSAGAVYQLANSLMGAGGWKARLGEATIDEVFAPLLESLELWERLRIPWGRFPIVEEIAQSLAIRGRPEAAFVLWGALDASRIQAPSKVGRGRRTDAFLADVRAEDAATWMSQGAAMTFDQAVAYARRAVAAVLIAA